MGRGKRIPSTERVKLRLEVARLYCEGMTQTAIAHQLDQSHGVQISPMEVSRLMKEAKAEGYVKFVFNPPPSDRLREGLIAKYKCLKDAVVVVAGSGYSFQQRMLARVAGEYFDRVVEKRPGLKIGISGGNTMYEVVSSLPEKHRDIDIYPTALTARGPDLPDHMDQMLIIGELWAKSGRIPKRAHYATLPPFDKGSQPSAVRKLYRGFTRLHKVKAVWEGMTSVDMVFASVGAVDMPDEYRQLRGRTLLDFLAEMNIDEKWLRSRGAVGDISHSFFDARGNPVVEADAFLTLGIPHIRAMASRFPDKVVVLIAGKYKERSLAGALAGRLCNVLVTDDETAASLLDSSGSS